MTSSQSVAIIPVNTKRSSLYASIQSVPRSKHSPSGLQKLSVNTLRTGDADLRFYITTVQDG